VRKINLCLCFSCFYRIQYVGNPCILSLTGAWLVSKARRDFKPLSFCRKMGTESLVQYVRKIHAQPDPLLAILESPQEDDEDAYKSFWQHIESPVNPYWQTDTVHLPLINDMAGEKGFAYLKRLCLQKQELEALLTPETTGHSLSMELFLNHREVFMNAHTYFCIDYLEGWQVYPGKGTSEYLEQLENAKEKFYAEIKETFTKMGYGNHMNVDAYPQQDRLILDIKYAGPLVRQEGFDRSGRIQGQTRRKPLDISLAYYPASTVLKVRTPRGLEALNQAIHKAFACSYLKRPQALLEMNTSRFINLEELKFRKEFPTSHAENIRSVLITGISLQASSSLTATKLTLQNAAGVMPILQNYPINMDDAILKSVTIQFEFEGKGKSRFRRAILKHTNTINTDNTERDAIIEGCLTRWGIMNG
jgi:hypothetical protein